MPLSHCVVSCANVRSVKPLHTNVTCHVSVSSVVCQCLLPLSSGIGEDLLDTENIMSNLINDWINHTICTMEFGLWLVSWNVCVRVCVCVCLCVWTCVLSICLSFFFYRPLRFCLFVWRAEMCMLIILFKKKIEHNQHFGCSKVQWAFNMWMKITDVK
jgi:hypothetical protein